MMPAIGLDKSRAILIKIACFREEIRTLGVRDRAVRCYILHLSVFLPNEMGEREEKKEKGKTIDDDGHEDEFGVNDLANLLLEEKPGKLLLNRLFDVPTEAAVRR
jgi:hypothetical protein